MAETSAWQRAFRREIEDALDLLRGAGTVADADRTEGLARALPGLLEQARAMAGPPPVPAMRSIHHFACTGGTLISRCIAAMPNIQVLSEVDPLSRMSPNQLFQPTDLIQLTQQAPRPAPPEAVVDIFLGGLRSLADTARRTGLRLVLRDHAHSHFCTGAAPADRPTLREILARDYTVRALVTVRHPLESYLSLLENGWIEFEPATLEEYARRHAAFLDRHDDVALLRYEDFLADPEAGMQRACEVLDLVYDPQFRDTFPAIRLSGDSGRRGDVIEPRPRRPVPDPVAAETGESPSYAALCARLGYDPAP